MEFSDYLKQKGIQPTLAVDDPFYLRAETMFRGLMEIAEYPMSSVDGGRAARALGI